MEFKSFVGVIKNLNMIIFLIINNLNTQASTEITSSNLQIKWVFRELTIDCFSSLSCLLTSGGFWLSSSFISRSNSLINLHTNYSYAINNHFKSSTGKSLNSYLGIWHARITCNQAQTSLKLQVYTRGGNKPCMPSISHSLIWAQKQ